MAHAARGRGDQHALSPAYGGGVQGAEGHLAAADQDHRGRVADLVGHGEHEGGPYGGELGVRAGEGQPRHPLPDLPAGHPGAGRHDAAGDLASGRVRQRHSPTAGRAARQPHDRERHADGADLDQQLTLARLRSPGLLDLEDLRAAVREAGLGGRHAIWAVDTLNYFVVGHTIEEQLAATLPEGGTEAAERLASALDPGHHPNMLASIGDLTAPHPEEHVDHGLRLIVDGIRLGAARR